MTAQQAVMLAFLAFHARHHEGRDDAAYGMALDLAEELGVELPDTPPQSWDVCGPFPHEVPRSRMESWAVCPVGGRLNHIAYDAWYSGEYPDYAPIEFPVWRNGYSPFVMTDQHRDQAYFDSADDYDPVPLDDYDGRAANYQYCYQCGCITTGTICSQCQQELEEGQVNESSDDTEIPF